MEQGSSKNTRRWIGIGVGAGVIGVVALFALSSRSLKSTVASEPASVDQLQGPAAPPQQQARDAQRELEDLGKQLAAAKDGQERARMQENLSEARGEAKKATGGRMAPRGPQKIGGCSPGDPLCDLGDAPPPPPRAAATALPTATATAGALAPVPSVAQGQTKGGRGRVDDPSAAAPAAEAPIDPNGRFATTYRPGAGHLAAFEASVAQGLVPDADRELVADVGARYAPDMEPPQTKAIAFKTDWERAKVQPDGGPVHLRLALRSSAKAPTARPHLSVHLVLDVSGSMGGRPMEDARKAAQLLVDKLAPTDDFSLVTFSTSAQVVVPDARIGDRKAQIKKTIEGIKENGGTNIGEGLRLGYQQALTKSIPVDAVKVVLLLSDGRANEGIIQQSALSRLALDAFQDGIQTSSFGIGSDYDGPLMSAIGSEGAGGYYYLRNSDQIAPALSAELDKRLDPVATAVEVRVRLKPGVELLHVYGSRRLGTEEAARVRTQEVAADKQAQQRDGIKANRQNDQEGGMRFFLPAFSRDDSHALLLKLRVPAGVGSKPVALLELKYKDRLSKQNVAEELPIALEYAASDAESGGTINPSMARSIQGFLAGESLAQASSLVANMRSDEALAMLSERESILREAAASLSEPLFLRDAERLSRLRSQLQPGSAIGRDPLVLAMLLETASRVHLR